MQRVPLRLGTLRQTWKPSSTVLAPSLVSEGPLVSNASLARVCRVCTTCEARYTCPRCNVPYCSVQCYRSHGENCTEQFFESHVRSEMQLMGKTRDKDEKTQQKTMHQLLERVREFQEEHEARMKEEDDDEARRERLVELERLEKAGHLTLESLTLEERKRFLGEVADGRLGKFLQLWTPWWLLPERHYRRETAARRRQLILEEVTPQEEETIELDCATVYPMRLFTKTEAAKMPTSLSALLPRGKLASPCLRFHLIEILFAYALVLRAFNGDYGQDVSAAAWMGLDLCRVLGVDGRYESLEHVCLACFEKQSSQGPRANVVALQDTQMLLQHHVFLLDALRDMQWLFERYSHELKQSQEAQEKEKKTVNKQLTKVHKKLAFYLTWVHSTPPTEFQHTATEIQLYLKERTSN